MARERILVVDDEEDIRDLLSYNFGREGYQVVGVASGEDCIAQAKKTLPDLIILDLLLPRVDGLEVCRILKNDPATRHIPIVMLTAKCEESDIVAGLELGADEYVTKPFTPRVLISRVRALLRRMVSPTAEDQDVLRIGELTIHPGRHEVSVAGKRVVLTFTEFRLLEFLARRSGWVFTRSQIVDAVKGDDYPVTERSVDVQVAGLRKKLGPFGEYIETVRGVGYRIRS
ncbi:MAG: response regulator [Pirellulales bacterium]